MLYWLLKDKKLEKSFYKKNGKTPSSSILCWLKEKEFCKLYLLFFRIWWWVLFQLTENTAFVESTNGLLVYLSMRQKVGNSFCYFVCYHFFALIPIYNHYSRLETLSFIGIRRVKPFFIKIVEIRKILKVDGTFFFSLSTLETIHARWWICSQIDWN